MIKKKSYILLLVLSVFMVQGALNGVNPAIESFAQEFPEHALSTIMLIATIPCLIAIPGSMLAGSMVEHLKYKGTLLVGLVFFLVGGVSPYFFHHSFYTVLFWRGIFGLGYGILYPMCASLVVAFFQGEKRAHVMGLGNTFNNVGSISFSLLGAALASIALPYIFLVHLIMSVSLVLVLFMPEPTHTYAAHSRNEHVPMGRTSVFYQILIGVVMLFFYPIFLYMSTIVTKAGFGGAKEASFLIAIVTICGTIAGLAFGGVFARLGKKIVPCSTCLMAVGFALLVFAPTLPLLYVSCILCGFGFYLLFPYLFMAIAQVTSPSLVPTANGYAAAWMKLFVFIAPYFHTFLGGLFGMENNPRFPFIPASIAFMVMTIAFLFAKEKPQDNN